MIGHYLQTLSSDAEDAVLTSRMAAGQYLNRDTGERCLVGCAGHLQNGLAGWLRPDDIPRALVAGLVENRYDKLCERFGTERVNAAIRNRILANQARRALRQVEVETPTL